MLCESCSEKEATVHLTQVVDGAVKKLHLCESCASQSGFDIHGPVSITDILLGMGGEKAALEVRPTELSCLMCGMTRNDFKKTGRLGCPTCYDTFTDELMPLIKAMHRSEQHVGKVPDRETDAVRITNELAVLQQALEDAVAKEKFEDAAEIRDKIKYCRKLIENKKEKSAS